MSARQRQCRSRTKSDQKDVRVIRSSYFTVSEGNYARMGSGRMGRAAADVRAVNILVMCAGHQVVLFHSV
jgi:hypothetical protein